MLFYGLCLVFVALLAIGAPLASQPQMGPNKIIGVCFVSVCVLIALYVVSGFMNQTI